MRNHGILRMDENPKGLRQAATDLSPGDTISFEKRVLVSSQDARDVAESIFDAVFVCQHLASAFESPSVDTCDVWGNPNEEAVRLSGVVKRPKVIRSFLDEWEVHLSTGMPIRLEVPDDPLMARLESRKKPSSFRFPMLVEWFREARRQFDDWDPEG